MSTWNVRIDPQVAFLRRGVNACLFSFTWRWASGLHAHCWVFTFLLNLRCGVQLCLGDWADEHLQTSANICPLQIRIVTSAVLHVAFSADLAAFLLLFTYLQTQIQTLPKISIFFFKWHKQFYFIRLNAQEEIFYCGAIRQLLLMGDSWFLSCFACIKALQYLHIISRRLINVHFFILYNSVFLCYYFIRLYSFKQLS